MVSNDIMVSVIIPTYRDNALLNKCIEAINNQFYPKENFEVIVVNNDPESEVEISVPHSLNLRILEESKPGSYAARNKGIKEARGEILAFTDSDCIPYPDWIENAVEIFQVNGIDRIGGEVNQFKENSSVSDAVYWYQKIFSFRQKKNIEEKGFSVTANLFVKKKVFENVGVFNESLFSGGDYEFGTRATNNEISLVYNTSVIVNHPVRPALKHLIQKKRRTTGGAFDLKKTHISLKYMLKTFLSPFYSFKTINHRLGVFLKIRVSAIYSIVKFTELFERIRLHLFNGRRLRS